MPVSSGSRFAGLPTYEVDGRVVLGLRLTAQAAPSSRTHTVTQGEAIDLIAQRHLGDEHLWWSVLDANPLRYPLELAAGDALALPDAVQAARVTRARSF